MTARTGLALSCVATLAACMASVPLDAQLPGQTWDVVPEVARARVGDTVTLRFRLRLDERDLLYDTVPRPLGVLPTGVRVLSVEKLQRLPDRIYVGRARVAFYRTGRQVTPIFGLPFMRGVKGVTRAMLPSDTASVEVVPILPAGDQPLKDIKPLLRSGAVWPLWAMLSGGFLVALATIFVRRRHRPKVEEAEPRPAARDPIAVALDRLRQIENEAWPEHGEVARHYVAVVDVMRDYLIEAEGIPAAELTTLELIRSLPSRLAQGPVLMNCRRLLREADLVKFAQARPEAPVAQGFLVGARELVSDWSTSPAPREETRAAR